jgi:glycerophosphoryl diester phosphodiesterase
MTTPGVTAAGLTVLSHRGYWKDAAEKNTEVAFRRSFDLGFGTETDVRDHAGELVISHDPPRDGAMPFEAFLDLLDGRDLPLALNVKADGLAAAIHAAMARRRLGNWFVFDMSVPDTLHQFAAGNPVYVRQSEHEPAPALVERAQGVWLDGFDGDWWTAETVVNWTRLGKAVCVVSPELHRRDPARAWRTLQQAKWPHPERVRLCTDRPEEAVDCLGGGR